MREYSKYITLTKNGRGIYSLDTIFGCNSGLKHNNKGCYGDCYSARISKKYGYDFSKNVLRHFKDLKHINKIEKDINKIELDFFRVGSNGDPSEDWEHTISVLEKLKGINKEIVIITRHWSKLTLNQLNRISKLNICINTSVSALDEPILLNSCLSEYERLKPYCKSILRVVSCDFNIDNKIGLQKSLIQEELFKNYKVLDTVFRVFKSNELVKKGIINISKTKFLGKECYVSKYNRKTFFGKCSSCLEMCGVNIMQE
jgi:hypothetical protein